MTSSTGVHTENATSSLSGEYHCVAEVLGQASLGSPYLSVVVVTSQTWHPYNDSSYTVATYAQCQNKSNCQAVCESFGANLVEIDTPEELEFLFELLYTTLGYNVTANRFWVGMERLSNDGAFRWSLSGDIVADEFWYTAPSTGNGIACGVLYQMRDSYKLMGYTVEYCDTVAWQGICEKSATVSSTTPGNYCSTDYAIK